MVCVWMPMVFVTRRKKACLQARTDCVRFEEALWLAVVEKNKREYRRRRYITMLIALIFLTVLRRRGLSQKKFSDSILTVLTTHCLLHTMLK